jgi:enterochelin esterase-like enzyme
VLVPHGGGTREHAPGAGATFGPMVETLRVDDPEPRCAPAPSYRPPAWLEYPAVTGTLEELGVRVLGREILVGIWSPTDGELPLLVAHDGPEYDALAALRRYAGAMIERGVLAPFRVALLPPDDRDEWYSASAVYGRALSSRILPALRGEIAVAGLPVGMGASLGALAMLQAQRSWPGTLAGLFMQSGSFFVPRFDRHESGFSRYGRITRFVGGVLRARWHAEPVPAIMTCGAKEENVHNNRLMCSSLAAQEYCVSLHEVPDLHNYAGWRDALDPYLTRLLTRLWPRR